MLDSHAHLGNIEYRDAFVSTPSIPDAGQALLLQNYRYRSVGILPGYPDSNIDLLPCYLERGFHLGEVGLDRRFSNIEKQEEILNRVLEIAAPYKRCVVFHQVGHFDRLMRIIKERKPERFILHGFTGSYESAMEVIKLGGLISIGPRSEKAKSFNRLLTLPFITETDMPTGDEEAMTLKLWNDKLSMILDEDISSKSEKLLVEYMNE